VILRPRLTQSPVTFKIDGVEHTVDAWSDMSALEVVREAVGRAVAPSKCEAGLCGTCESLINGDVVRICSVSARRLDGTTVVLPNS
jgi:aerobic-type carbon monoxide dehydrogenase small subunit (CoxS/CutS family)